MLTFNLGDPNLVENTNAAMLLKASRMFSEQEIQKMYDDQMKKDEEDKQ